MERMRKCTLGELQVSVLGFGCGAVMGRVGPRESLRAMGTAWDEGINLFDTARSYGYGDAEAVLGEFVRGKRDQAVIATKYGVAPEKLSRLRRVALPLVRSAMQFPRIRSILRRSRLSSSPKRQFTVAGLRSSIETSLRQLRTDYVDLLYLHEATSDTLRQQDLMTELDTLVRAGKVLRVGVYCGMDVAVNAADNGPAIVRAVQFGADLFDPLVTAVSTLNHRGLLLAANHPFGSEKRVARVSATLKAMSEDDSVPGELRTKLRDLNPQGLLEAIFGMVLNGMRADLLVFSMMKAMHLRANARAVENCRFTGEELSLMHERLLNSPAPI